MKTLNLKAGIDYIGALDPDLRIFDIIMHTEFGTTYNSYLVRGSEKTAIFETVKIKFWDKYIANLQKNIDVSSIDYIIANHTEPDHAGSIGKLLQLAPNAVVVGSASAIRFIKEIINQDFESIVVNTGDSIKLGDKTLEFISAPFLHWPDSIYTYIKEDKTLITCDSFGSHYCFDDILFSKLDNKDDYMKALKYYFDMIMGPFKEYMLKAIEKIEDLEIDMICPGHGPVLDINPREIVEICRKWSTEHNPNSVKTVVIPFVSAYGYTEELTKAITKGLISCGDIKVESLDMVHIDAAEAMEKIYWADGVIFGSPTINSEALPPIWDLLVQMSPIAHGRKFASAFGSYGWSGEAVPNIMIRLKQLRMKCIPGFKVNFRPSEKELQDAIEFGINFGDKVLGNEVFVASTINEDRAKVQSNDGVVKSWKCIVCNEVFDGVTPPDICPACGASHEQFEEFIEEKNTFTSDMETSIVIVGNNAAATSAAEAIRGRNSSCQVLMITKDNDYGYYRPMLPDYISGNYNKNMFYLHKKSWYEENNIKLMLNTEVVKVSPEANTITTSDGQTIAYQKLILANGSSNFIPAITDNNKPGVFSLKSKLDADNIKAYAEKSKSVVVIGGGLLGLEVAWELKDMGLDVTVLEAEKRILPRQLDKEGSRMLEDGIIKSGVRVLTNALANGIIGHESVSGVQLCDGELIPCDMVLISAGIRSNSHMAREAGLEVSRGIVVDKNMKTSNNNIYACGDVAEFDNVSYAIWPVALEQGKIAGANAVGDSLSYQNSTPSNVFNGMNMNVFSIGDIGMNENNEYKTIIQNEAKNAIYKKLVFVNNKFVGGILIGDIKKSMAMIKGISAKSSIDEMIQNVLL